jgi:pimeloyl-ACP methyl ester carboxylesterase
VTDAYHGLTAPVAGPVERVLLEDIRTPALVLWGAEDLLITVEDGRQGVAKMKNAQFVVLEKVGHVPMEEAPEAVLAHALPFLESQPR